MEETTQPIAEIFAPDVKAIIKEKLSIYLESIKEEQKAHQWEVATKIFGNTIVREHAFLELLGGMFDVPIGNVGTQTQTQI